MSNKPRAEVPGEVPSAGLPGAAIQPETVANGAKVFATQEAHPEALTLEALQTQLLAMQKQLAEQNKVIAQHHAESQEVANKLPNPVTMDEAKKIAKKHIDDGNVPPAILTVDGWFVHQLTHSGTDDVEKQQERDEKAAKKAAKAKD